MIRINTFVMYVQKYTYSGVVVVILTLIISIVLTNNKK